MYAGTRQRTKRSVCRRSRVEERVISSGRGGPAFYDSPGHPGKNGDYLMYKGNNTGGKVKCWVIRNKGFVGGKSGIPTYNMWK